MADASELPDFETGWSLRDRQLQDVLVRRSRGERRVRPGMVEIVLVKAGDQPFGLMSSQVFNILPPGTSGLTLYESLPDPENSKQWGEVRYRGEVLRVLELAQMLRLPLIEPIQSCRVLLTGQVGANGQQPYFFGVAIEEVLSIRYFKKEDLRLLPKWITRGLNGLVWGAMLVEQEYLQQEDELLNFQPDFGLQPVVFTPPAPKAAQPAPSEGLRLVELNDRLQPRQTETTPRRPVMLLNLDVLQAATDTK